MGLSSSKISKERKMSKDYVLTVSARGKHTATLIFLHGLGDTGDGWASTLADIRPPHVKVLCPTAVIMPVTLNSGFRMPSWFDLISLNDEGPEDAAGIKRAESRIQKLIEEEISNGIDPKRIVIGGFSQGGALALHIGLAGKHKLGGVIAMSCWLPLKNEFNCKGKEDVPVIQLHGDCDPVVPYKWAQQSSTILKKCLINHTFKTYKGLSHSSSKEELSDIGSFLNKVLSPHE